MRNFSNTISLTKNARGVYSIDPILGCSSGTAINKKGCYNSCYAASISKAFGYNFTKHTLRGFESQSHLHAIKNKIDVIDFPFIRMGTMGEPSENWEHTINICESLQKPYQLSLFSEPVKEIVIITKHWKKLSSDLLERIGRLKICVNTSISPLDSEAQLKHRISEYERLKPFCRSILRVVSCDFNKENKKGLELSKVQDSIFKNYNVIDTIFRVNLNNKLVKDGIIKTTKSKFLGSKCNVSRHNKKSYFGKCDNCIEKCGIAMN